MRLVGVTLTGTYYVNLVPVPLLRNPRTGAKSVLATFVAAHVVNDFYATVMPAFLPALADELDSTTPNLAFCR